MTDIRGLTSGISSLSGPASILNIPVCALSMWGKYSNASQTLIGWLKRRKNPSGEADRKAAQ